MLERVRLWLCGWREIRVKSECAAEVFDMIYKSGADHRHEKRNKSGDIIFKIRSGDFRRNAVGFECLREKEALVYSDEYGFPALARFFFTRPAFIVWGLLFSWWMYYSSHIIWDVRITGNTKTPTEKIVSQLEELGCGVGDYFPAIDFNKLHSVYAASQNDIAWLSVYMNGTVAEVQVRELYRDTRAKHERNVYANVVSECDGVVNEINVFDGIAAVKKGDVVRKGQVLISGVIEGKDGEWRFEYASGEVFVTTSVPIEERVCLNTDEKRYTGRSKTKYSIKIFKKTVNLFLNGGIDGGVYDTIDMMEKLCPLGVCEIPVWINKKVYREYEPVSVTLTPEEAVETAVSSIREKIRRATENGELESRETEAYFDGGEYVMRCLLYVRKNAARTAEFTADEINTTAVH